jgi:hypothetical protein
MAFAAGLTRRHRRLFSIATLHRRRGNRIGEAVIADGFVYGSAKMTLMARFDVRRDAAYVGDRG